jgi:hypothetical protein
MEEKATVATAATAATAATRKGMATMDLGRVDPSLINRIFLFPLILMPM